LRASRRKKIKRVSRLMRYDGSFSEDPHELNQMTREFYNTLYTSDGTMGMEEVLQTMQVSVTTEVNEQLIVLLEEGEVKQALFQMYPLKAPGPGFQHNFFRNIGTCVEWR
jgi:hypothetical protein